MMERPDAIAVLEGMHHLNLKMLDFEEFRRCRTAAGQYRKRQKRYRRQYPRWRSWRSWSGIRLRQGRP